MTGSRGRRGLCVAVLGPDGAGKSTILEMLAADPPAWSSGAVLRHLKPSVIGRKTEATVDPHASPPRGLSASIAKCLYWLVEYTVGYQAHVKPDLDRGRLVLFDRYLLDVIVDPRRYRYGGPAWLARLLWRLVPKPGLVILLHAPVDVLLARKQELSRAEMERQLREYRALVARQQGGHLVDVSGTPEDIVLQIRAIIDDAAADQPSTAEALAGV